MLRITLERQQVWIYVVTIICGLMISRLWPDVDSFFERLLWPVLIVLLYTTFVQVPLLHLRDAFRDRGFISAALLGNFILLPLLVWGLVQILPNQPALRLGVLLVLLVPCTDWFITFTQMGRGSSAHALALAPVMLLLQIMLLPVYLWWMSDADLSLEGMPQSLLAALLIILVPLICAAMSERWLEAQPQRLIWRERLGWCPVPLLALVILLITASQAASVQQLLSQLPLLILVFSLFLLAAGFMAKSLSWLFKLPVEQGRTLAFSFGTRNSFVVLPVALALPAGWELVAMVVVLQSLVELLGMVFYLWWVPRKF
ncbi:MAG: arsenic resistance protein [Nitrincola lacisaponensis]|uniref:arsenic resistance protein n=1 Tax=Nitrincola lacisaponensis TaxID=267850 RepID=UPI00391D7967